MILEDLEHKHWIQRYGKNLDLIPPLFEAMREDINPLKSGWPSGVFITGGDKEAPLPFRDEPMDDCNLLWSVIALYVGEIAERLQDPAPGALGASWATEQGVEGIPARMGPLQARNAGFEIVNWLIDRADIIRDLGMEDSTDHLFSLIRGLHARYTREIIAPPADTRLPMCELCFTHAVIVVKDRNGGLFQKCQSCGQTYLPGEESMNINTYRPDDVQEVVDRIEEREAEQ